ncbi:MAG: hypothetical protein CM15mP78_12340 [Candidatus Poseidoniales archaeon]|nr:MAG: hypothetical protein CM15mP78_12340 [Candidatus Poseidoniales archaeon]
MGMSEVLRSIKTAEQEAEKRLAEAQEEASKILSDARRKASETVQDAADETVVLTQKILDDARSKAQGGRPGESHRRPRSQQHRIELSKPPRGRREDGG